MTHRADTFDRTEILPPDPEGAEVLHDREYRVRAFRQDPNILIRGAVRDQKPPGLYFPGDPNPLTIHHMQVDIEVAFPSLEIVAAHVHFEMHPNDTCPVITTHYDKLVGLSIARGFTHKVRELFGGPRGCTHTTALLLAMAPVAVQCFWSMTASEGRRAESNVDLVPKPMTREQRAGQMQMNLNTCHIWAEDSETVRSIESGVEMSAPKFARERLDQLGLTEDDWRRGMRGA